MEHLIGQHYVDHSINVHTHVEILMVTTSESCTNTSVSVCVCVCGQVCSYHMTLNSMSLTAEHISQYTYTHSPVEIEHGSNPIKPKSINTILFYVPPEIGKKKT